MKRLTLIATALVLAVLAVLSTRVTAQETNTQEVTYLTFSNSVELPGVTLPAGTYTFRLADTPSRNVVQVLDRDGKEMKGQWLFVQAERPEVSGDTVIMFKENREGTTPAVQYWYFPGEKIGKEFIYPKDQAAKIAARTGQKVRTDTGYAEAEAAVSSTESPAPVASNTVEGPGLPPESTVAVDNSANAPADNTLRDAPAASQPTASAGSLTGNRGIDTTAHADVDVNAQVDNSASDSPRTVGTSGSSDAHAVGTSGTLPQTASPLPLSGLIGLLSLAGAFGTRAARK